MQVSPRSLTTSKLERFGTSWIKMITVHFYWSGCCLHGAAQNIHMWLRTPYTRLSKHSFCLHSLSEICYLLYVHVRYVHTYNMYTHSLHTHIYMYIYILYVYIYIYIYILYIHIYIYINTYYVCKCSNRSAYIQVPMCTTHEYKYVVIDILFAYPIVCPRGMAVMMKCRVHLYVCM